MAEIRVGNLSEELLVATLCKHMKLVLSFKAGSTNEFDSRIITEALL